MEKWRDEGLSWDEIGMIVHAGYRADNNSKRRIIHGRLVFSLERPSNLEARFLAHASDEGIDVYRASPGWKSEIHHELPIKFSDRFAQLGLDINDPRYLKQVFRSMLKLALVRRYSMPLDPLVPSMKPRYSAIQALREATVPSPRPSSAWRRSQTARRRSRPRGFL